VGENREDGLKSRVFISCGQHSPREVAIAKRIGELLEHRGFEPYVAKEVQNVFEINSGIIGQLKNSDCYLLVNFRREQVDPSLHRGSLFSNQEFAVAYALGFDRIIVVNETGVKSEGMLGYIGCNTKALETDDECLIIVENALDRSEWEPSYSRRLRAENIRLESFQYKHFTGELMDGRFLSLDIANGRSDVAAAETSGRLLGFRRRGTQHWTPRSVYHRSLLKASGRSGFSHTIFPSSSESFNIAFLGTVIGGPEQRADGVYLNSALDFTPNPPLPIEPGEWELLYQFLPIGFPPLCAEVCLRYGTFTDAEAQVLRQYTASGSSELRQE
jgi:hypothetical protein